MEHPVLQVLYAYVYIYVSSDHDQLTTIDLCRYSDKAPCTFSRYVGAILISIGFISWPLTDPVFSGLFYILH